MVPGLTIDRTIDAAMVLAAWLLVAIASPFYVVFRVLVGLDNLRNGVPWNYGFKRCA